MPMHSGPMNHQALGVGSHQGQHRMRAFTADSSTLAQMPRMTDPFDDSMTDYASGFESVLDLSPHALQPRYSQGDLLPTHGQSPRALPTDFSTEQLRLLSRMRRLEDIKTIANTNAMRSKQAMELSTGIVPATAEPISPTAYHAPTGPNGAPAMPAALLPVKKAATTSALMGTSSDMMLQPQLYHASSDIASMHQLANSVGHSHHSSSDISGQDRSGAPLGPGVPSADASLILGADIGSFNLAQTQLLGDIMSQCGPMNFFQNIGNQEQDLHSTGLPLDAASSNSGLGELGEQLFAPGPLSPKLAALAQPEPAAANESQASAVDKPIEEQLIPSSLFSNSIGVLKKREQPPYSSGAAEKACFAPTVSSTPPLGNGEPDPNATLASFLFNTNSPPLFQPDVTPYAPNVANQGQAPIAVQGPIKHWPNSASVVSVAASGHAGQRDLTIEQLHPYASI
ncbi:hypothetical protein IWW47_005245 [Coemansia sp. RSA 2052]|nr:hypothetical protein IWW47_005245 [Coemansia sp. RSA 2052]